MIAAYCWPQSASAGEHVDLMISASAPTVTVAVTRVGAEELPVIELAHLAVGLQPIPDDVAVDGCAWPVATTIEVDAEWPSGFYLVRVIADDGETSEAFFVVRRPPAGPYADALLVLTTSTWAAYNDWGGPSFYTGGHISSLQRPLPRGFLDKPDPARFRVARFGELPRAEVEEHFAHYSYWSAAAGWSNWERLFVAWAEREGLHLDYATSLDLAREPDLLAPYRLYLSVGHDEYWSASMRDSVENWVQDGGAAVFLSGNTAFWQVRFDDAGTQVVGYKNDFALDPVVGTKAEPSVSTMWSDPLCGRPESEMTGVTFTRGGYAHCFNAPTGTGGYTVWRPDHWPFEGLRLRAGDVLGADLVVVGYECDGCELQLVDGLPVAAGTAGTPKDFEVLATAPAHLWATEEGPPGLPDTYTGELNWVAERIGGADTPENRERFAHGYAVMGTFRLGRGEVLTVGCTDWAYGLGDHAVSKVTRNIVSRYVDDGSQERLPPWPNVAPRP